MASLAKTLIFFGILLVALGAILSIAPKIPWLGQLPGDIYFHRGSFTFYFPLATCLLLSVKIGRAHV